MCSKISARASARRRFGQAAAGKVWADPWTGAGAIEPLRVEVDSLYQILTRAKDGRSDEASRHRRELASINIELRALIGVHARTGMAPTDEGNAAVRVMTAARLRLRIAALALELAGADAWPDHSRLGDNERVGPHHFDSVAHRYFEAVTKVGKAELQGYTALRRALLV